MSNEEHLNAGWTMCKLGDIVNVHKQVIYPCEHPRTYFNYVSIGNIKSETGALVEFAKTIGANIKSSKIVFTKRDILYSKLRPNLNKVFFPDFDGISSTDLIPLTPKAGIERKYVGYYLRRQQTVQYAISKVRGNQLPRIALKDLLALPFILAPTNEQKRIVFEIELALSQIRTIQNAVSKVLNHTKLFRNYILRIAFQGKLCPQVDSSIDVPNVVEKTGINKYKSFPKKSLSDSFSLPQTWVWTKIGDVFKVSSGGTPKRNIPAYWGGTIPWVKSSEVVFKDIIRTQETITNIGLKESAAKINPPGTVLIALYGDGRTRGQTAILKISAATNQAVASILTSGTDFPPEYLYWWLRYRYTENRKIGVGTNQKNMYLRDVVNMPFPLAPLTEQRRIVKTISSYFEALDKIELNAIGVYTKAQWAGQSILHQAFLGKMTAANPTDEPATVLLDRINKVKDSKVTRTAVKSNHRKKSVRRIIDILRDNGSAKVEDILQETGLSIQNFWDELEKEMLAGRIQEERKDGLVYLRVKS